MKRNIELEAGIVEKFAALAPVLDERSRRRWAATESLAMGYGGDALISDGWRASYSDEGWVASPT